MANVYINPDHTNDGDGDGTADKTGAGGAHNDWASVSWSAGNSYLQKRGTTFTGSVTLDATGTSVDEIHVGAYYNADGTDNASQPKPIIDANNASSQALKASGKEFINYRDIVVKNATGSGMVMWGHETKNTSYCTIRRCEAHDCAGAGIIITTLPNYASYEKTTNTVIDDCKAYNCGGHGISILGELDDCRIKNSYAYACCYNSNTWGVYMSPRSSKISGNVWVAAPNSSWETDITSSSLQANENLVELIFEGRPDASPGNQVFTEGTFDSLNNDEWAQSGSTIQLKATQDPNNRSVVINVTHAVNCSIENCHAEYTRDDTAGDGNGIGFDHYVQNSIIRRCKSNNNTGKGLSDHIGENNVIEGCLVLDNAGSGIGLISSLSNVSSNNTISGNDSGFLHGYAATATLKNNIVVDNGEDIKEGPVATNDVITEDYNCVYNNTVTNETGTNNITSDPLLDTNYQLISTSPCVGVGVKWWGTSTRPVGYDGEPFPDWDIDIGANQSLFSPFHPVNL